MVGSMSIAPVNSRLTINMRGNMRVAGFTVFSSLGVKENADLFKSTTSGMYGGSAKFAAGVRRISGQMKTAQRLEFFKPTNDSPFSALDDDVEDFAVGVSIPKAVGTGGGSIVLQLFVWDRGDRREARVRSPYSIGSASSTRKALNALGLAYQEADPGAAIRED
jgi:hypothetical protein